MKILLVIGIVFVLVYLLNTNYSYFKVNNQKKKN